MKLKGLDPWIEILNEIFYTIIIHDYLYDTLKKCDPSYKQLVALAFSCAKWDKICSIARYPWQTCALCVLDRNIKSEGLHCISCVLQKNDQWCLEHGSLYKTYALDSTDKNRQAMQDFLIKLYAEELKCH